MLDKLRALREKYDEINRRMTDPEVLSNAETYRRLSIEQAELAPVVEKAAAYEKLCAGIREAEEILRESDDAELREMARAELDELKTRQPALEQELRLLLVPKDPRDARNVILEIRAGTGGEEAALFAGDLFRMYARYAEGRGWKITVVESNETGIGGMKEVVASIEGRGVFSRLKYESGVHRVQRIPATEASGRIHTSAATVAVLPEAEDVEVRINEKDLRIDTFCSSGAGGQSVNTAYSAVRIVHIPTGIVVSCQDERSQLKNREKAMKVLKARLYDAEAARAEAERSADRRTQVGTGDRSERIRTYNFPQNRVTDHRIGLTLHKLDRFMEGELDEVLDALITHFSAERLKAGEAGKAAG